MSRAVPLSIAFSALLLVPGLAGQAPVPREGQDPMLLRGVEFDQIDTTLAEPHAAGHEEEGNDFRGRTPPLLRGDRSIATVDAERLHRRKIAMYEDGEVFASFLPVEGEMTEVQTPAPAAAEEAPASPWRWIVGALLVVVALALAKFALARR
jgi:hypothetical protein